MAIFGHALAASGRRAAHTKLFVPRKQGEFATLRKLHHKLMVVDECIVVAGSFNYTLPANDYNDENIFVLGSPFDEVEDITVDHTACEQLGKHMKTKIERIISLSEPYAPDSP
jgi:phosphatidylserine/phosphatidylglycerophosphate/cardiolipin synthase-like enzyme